MQRHKHSKTCKKKGRAICRFNFPLPRMPRTMILEPLSESDLDEDVADMLKEALGRIRSLLNSMNADETMTFVEFLEKLDLTEQQYIKAIRLSLKHSTLLLKRSPSEIRINCYNPHLLRRRATRRVEELLVASKSYSSCRRATRRVEELHVASKSFTSRRRGLGMHDASKRCELEK